MLVGSSNVFQCFGHVNLSNKYKYSNQPWAGKKDLCLMIGLPRMFFAILCFLGPPEVFKDACGHFQCFSALWTCEFKQQKNVLQPTQDRQKVLCLISGLPRMAWPFNAF